MPFTEEQVAALVTDPGSLKRGRALAGPAQWSQLGQAPTALWGACTGSGSQPYRTGIDLAEPAFKCSCPSRVFPCKHGVGLLLLFARQPELLPLGPPPPWLAEWLGKRQAKGEAQAEKAAVQPAPPPAATEPGAAPATNAAAQKREAQRLARMAAGADELETWLLDLVRAGLGSLEKKPATFWEAPAARLVDNQLPGLATALREIAALPTAGPGWSQRLLGRLGELYLLLQAFRHLAHLPPAAQADVRQQLGLTPKKDELLAAPAAADRVLDTWAVLGQHTWAEDRLTARRSWLRGHRSGRMALVLEFAFGGQSFATPLLPQARYAGELVFYPGQLPLRALALGLAHAGAAPELPGAGGMAVPQLLDAYADALARQPWLREYPATLAAVVPLRQADGSWALRDAAGHAAPTLPLRLPAGDDLLGWHLLALSGGQALGVFGEWDGQALRPLHYWLAPVSAPILSA